ncbi:MAG: ATP-dependent DNA ligase [Candidatus Micrarchaeaceae archaeon]
MLFSDVAEYYSRLEGLSSRLDMISLLAEMLGKADKSEMRKLIYMTQGVLAPPFESIEFGIADKTVEDALAAASGRQRSEIEALYKQTGDLGLVAEQIMAKSKLKRMTSKKQSFLEIFDSMLKIATSSGKGSKESKTMALAGIIGSLSPIEARYLTRYPLGQLRLGLGDSTIIEALSIVATGSRDEKASIERAYNICSDLGYVGEVIASSGISGVKNMHVALFKPIRPALAERLPTSSEILERMGGVCAVEQKYDGFRCQVHKDGKKVKMYSRNLEEITSMLPDIAKAVVSSIKADKAIFEGEALAFNETTGEFMPFQETIQRKRKHGVDTISESMPLRLFSFDIMYLEGTDMLNKPYEERRKALEGIIPKNGSITTSSRIIAKSPRELDEFFESSIENGLEGIVAKDLNAPYVAGARKFSWIKMKRSYKGEISDTFDLVIIGYYLGKGSRASFEFGGLLCATYNPDADVFESVSRLGTGFTEKQMKQLESILSKNISPTKPKNVLSGAKPDYWVYPKFVVTVQADEITKSPMHMCGRHVEKDGSEVGYALRFPRLVGEDAIRPDKSYSDATTSKEVEEMYQKQKRVSLKA